MRRRRTRKQWYQHHLAKAQEDAKQEVVATYGHEVESIRRTRDATWEAYKRASESEPAASKLRAFFGADSEYRRDILRPLKSDLDFANRALDDALERQRRRLEEAAKLGSQNYQNARIARRQEAAERAARVKQRKYERRLRYLAVSPAIRSAGRVLKEHLISEQSEGGESVVCHYCEQVIAVGDSHLEHKRPISRGGTNNRGNLVLSCARCNLKKGQKTYDEFLRDLGKRP